MNRATPFTLLNSIQFFAAINENLYKLLAAYFLIGELGAAATDSIMSTVGALFILPFLLFSSLGGLLADRWPKSRIVIATRFFELLCLIAALFFFGYRLWYGAYLVLFLMASLSALFGPSKYAIIPELVPRQRLLYANSLVAAFTYLGIIIGTTLASFSDSIASEHTVYALSSCILFALAGLLLSLRLPATPAPAPAPRQRVGFFIYAELWRSLREMRLQPLLFNAAFAYAYFLFLGAYMQLNIIPYATEILGFSDVAGGYLFLVTAFGLAIGAFACHTLSREKIRLGLVPLSGFALSFIMLLMRLFFTPWWLVLIWMGALGFFGGLYLVPTQAYIMAASSEASRGRNFATANFFSFAFALAASLALYLFNTVLGLNPADSFALVGLLNLIVMLFISWGNRQLEKR